LAFLAPSEPVTPVVYALVPLPSPYRR
jgi:hypothetical protein